MFLDDALQAEAKKWRPGPGARDWSIVTTRRWDRAKGNLVADAYLAALAVARDRVGHDGS